MKAKSLADRYWWYFDENGAVRLNKYPRKKTVILKHQGTPETVQVFVDGVGIPRREKPNDDPT